MGHLVNPIGLRAGFKIAWIDTWHIPYLYYPILLHNIVMVREYLTFIFDKYSFARMGLLFSHLLLQKRFNSLHVSIFLYDGIIEDYILSFVFQGRDLSFLTRSAFYWLKLVYYFKDNYFFLPKFVRVFRSKVAGGKKVKRLLWRLSVILYGMFGANLVRFEEVLRAKDWDGVWKLLLRCKVRFESRVEKHMLILLLSKLFYMRGGWLTFLMKRFFSELIRVSCVCNILRPCYGVVRLWISRRLREWTTLPVKVSFFGLTNGTVTSAMVSKYIANKLKHRHLVSDVISPLRTEMLRLMRPRGYFAFVENYGKVLGFKVHLKGRFSRKQIASSIWLRVGRMPLTRLEASIDYAFTKVFLKNSVCSIKVWMYKRKGFSLFSYKI